MKWGEPGPGRWMTVYANPGHVYHESSVGCASTPAGAPARAGSRWQSGQRGAGGFAVRHWPGLDGGRGAGAASPMDSTDRIQTVNDSAQHSDPRDSAVSSGVIVQRKPSIARRGAQIALVATARKLCVVVLAPAHARGGLRLRSALRSRAASCARSSSRSATGWRRGKHSGPRVHETRKDREREREFAEQAEIAYRRLVKDWQPKPKKKGAGATPGRASSSHLLGEETSSAAGLSPRTCALARRHPHQARLLQKGGRSSRGT